MIGKVIRDLYHPNMQAISGMDATFLYGETPTSPMHVGSVAVIEGSLKYEDFRKTICSRIHMIPNLRKRLMTIPFSIDYPYWVDDPNFNPDLHLHHVALPRPGGWKELRAMASMIFSEPLDKSRPLWSFTFVEGLDSITQVPKGSVAIISKIHHVAVDGMAGAGILSLLFDLTPDPPKPSEPKAFHPEPLPNELGLMVKSAISFATKPLKLPRIIADTLSASLKTGFLTRARNIDLPTAPFTAPHTPLNGLISAKRKWNTAILSLDRLKILRRIMDTTLNDVMLAICAGALRRYLLEKNKLPKKPLVAMVPISTRQESDSSNAGNQLSVMLVQLATQIEDPIERLETIHENTVRGKTYQGALGAKTLSNFAEAVPFGIANQAARLYSRYQIAKIHKPAFNVVITNVPGPQLPLFLSGHKLLSVMGMAPIIDGMGLIITIFSYNGIVTISPTTDTNSMPDVDIFSRYLRESANDLEKAVLQLEKEKDRSSKKEKVSPKSDALFEYLRTYFKKNNEELDIPKEGIFQFHVPGLVTSDWVIDFNKSPARVRRGRARKPDVSLTIRDEHLQQIVNGQLDLQTAIIQGRLVIKGNKTMASAFGKILDSISL